MTIALILWMGMALVMPTKEHGDDANYIKPSFYIKYEVFHCLYISKKTVHFSYDGKCVYMQQSSQTRPARLQ